MLDTHAAGDVPVIVLEGETMPPAALGALFYFFELANAIFACACGIDPFDLPKVLPSRQAAAASLGKPEETAETLRDRSEPPPSPTLLPTAYIRPRTVMTIPKRKLF